MLFEQRLIEFITECKKTLVSFNYAMISNRFIDDFNGIEYEIYVANSLQGDISRFSIENNNPVVLPLNSSVEDVIDAIFDLIDSMEINSERVNNIEIRFV